MVFFDWTIKLRSCFTSCLLPVACYLFQQFLCLQPKYKAYKGVFSIGELTNAFKRLSFFLQLDLDDWKHSQDNNS